MWLTVQRELT
eukprot:CCRYP_019299-RA/>CCRYP_019299-RA protein AED:0.43 eAED:1.00 QI:0/-1/0/1/-1/0/1/0/10